MAMDPNRWVRDARRKLARLPSLRMTRVPDAPALPVRDLWPGDPNRGANLLKGELELGGTVGVLKPGGFAEVVGSDLLRSYAHGFTWLRDLRALGTDGARMRARALVQEWIGRAVAGAAVAAPGRGRRPDRRLARPLRLFRCQRRRRLPPAADGATGVGRAQLGGGAADRGTRRTGAHGAEGADRGGGGTAGTRRVPDPGAARAATGDRAPDAAGRLPWRTQPRATAGRAAGPDRNPRIAAGRAGAAADRARRRDRADGAGPALAAPRRSRPRAVQRQQGGKRRADRPRAGAGRPRRRGRRRR